jgi:hypothetical protein
MCHEEDFTELREGDLGARLGQALVGGTYILIHAANVNSSAVEIEEDAQAIDVSPIATGATVHATDTTCHSNTRLKADY